ncbi:MAG TPA: CRISPR-associated protein Cas4 [Candidatus Atribacteria bacterium]|nr:CRISPR-associated protein Cas4 [Candidatus Atribacteria bacterium]
MEEIIKEGVYITPSEVIEYLYCPRFIYFMNCLSIPQHEEQRYKVLMGREIHEKKSKINKEYLRKKLHCIKKEISVYLASDRYHLKGVVDEVLFLEDGTLAPLDYKFAEYKDRLFRTHKIQSVLYAILIKENYHCEVNKGYICYTRSKNLVKEILFKEKDFRTAFNIIEEMLRIIQLGYYPKGTSYSAKCIDCCYKNICV